MKDMRILPALLIITLASGSRISAQPVDTKPLIAAVEKLNGYTETDRKDPQRPVLILRFRSPGPQDADLEKLRSLLQASPLPVYLNLNQCRSITDAGIAHLADLGIVVELGLGETKVTDAGLKHLAGLKNLERLYLANEGLTDAGLAHLGKLTQLRKLSVYCKKVTEAGFAHLKGLTQIEEIHVGRSEKGDVCLGYMKGMTKIKELSVGRDDLTDAGMAHLRNFTELRTLRIDGPKVTKTGVAHLAALKKLEELTVFSCPGLGGDGTAVLKDMTELRSLDLINSGALDKAGIEHLAKLPGLKKLRLGSVRDAAFEGFKGMTKLEGLGLNYSGVSDEGIKHLVVLTGLRDLNLYATRVTNEGLKHVGAMTSLQRLSLSNNKKITDDGVKHLAGLNKLETLSLQDCGVAGGCLKDLSGLSSLKTLWLNGNPVTDAGVMELKSLRALKDLYLTGTKVSDEAAIELKKSRPDMRIADVTGDDVTLAKNVPVKPKIVSEDLSKTAPAFTMTADKFFAEYKADRDAASKKYKGQVIELSGTVASMGRNFAGESHVALQAGKDFLGVMCFTAEFEPWTKVVPGQKVKIKGKWPDYPFVPTLIHCDFIETGKYEGIALSAAELAKEYATDHEAASKKYDKKYLILTGVVENKEFNSAGAASVQLKVAGKVKVFCSFTAFEKDVTKAIKVGQSIKLIGEYTLNSGKDEVGIYFCLPINLGQ